jgi:tetratricopeptide (TPR) repeat protein
MPFSRSIARYVLAALVLAAESFAWAAENLQDPALNPGFIHFFNNEYDEALAYFENQVKASPNDPDQYNHVAQTILYRELWRNGALESQLVSGNNTFLQRSKLEITAAHRERFKNCINKAAELSEARIRRNPRDTRAFYALGVAHGLQANYFFLVDKAWMDALREASAARKSEERVLEIDPQFVDARLILGVYQYVVACLPFYLRAVGFVNGFHGDKEGGIRQLQLVASKGVLNRHDAEVLLAVLYRREHKPRQAIPLLQELSRQFERNYLFRFEQVQMYSDLGDKKSALAVLATIESLRRAGAPGYGDLRAEKVQYVTGNLHFWYGDLDRALENLRQATSHADELDLSTAVMAWLRLGQVYDLQGDHQEAIAAYRASMRIAPGSDVAAEAKGYISNRYKRKPKEEGNGQVALGFVRR